MDAPASDPPRARVVSDAVVHVVLHRTLYVLTCAASARRFTAAAAPACRRHFSRHVLLCVSEPPRDRHSLLLVSLPAASASVISLALPTHRAARAAENYAVVVAAAVSHSFSSVLALVEHASPPPHRCCRWLLCARRALLQLQLQLVSDPHAPVAIALVALRQHAAHDAHALALAAPAPPHAARRYVAVTRAGAVHVVHSLLWPSHALPDPPPLLHLHQTPVQAFSSQDGLLLTVVGCFRRVLSLAFERDGALVSDALFIPRAAAREPFALRARCFRACAAQRRGLLLRPTADDAALPCVSVQLQRRSSALSVSHRLVHPSSCATPCSAKPPIRPLLHAIDRLSLRSAQQLSHEASVQHALSTALHMFACVKSSPVPLSVALTVHASPRGVVPSFHLPTPPTSKLLYLVARLTPTHSSPPLSCLSLRVCVSAHRRKSPSKLPLPQRCLPRERTFVTPLPTLSPSQCTQLSFPLFLSSHAPLNVSVALLFDVPNENPLQLALHQQLLDVLSFSTCTEHFAQDTSAAMFAMPFSKPNPPAMHHSRVCVPYSLSHVQSALSIGPQPKHYETLLGAPFSLLATEARICTITIRAPTHVTPFVRAALLRRLLRAHKPEPIVVQGMSNLRSWRKAVLDSVLRCEPYFSDAEERLVEAVRVFEALENGGDGNGIDVWKQSLTKAAQAYRAWRREAESAWTPMGAAS